MNKRVFDMLISIVSIMILIIPMFVLYLMGLAFMGCPVLFKQKRVGKNDSVFTIYKFRTMITSFGEDNKLLPDSDRLTSLGKFLRITSLDEIPQLFNILKGDMSLVGPRALPIDYQDLYSDEVKRRHLVRPGLTGLAQVNGRNRTSWKERFEYDLFYVDNQSVFLDMKIILKTMQVVFNYKKVNKSGELTMDRYNGNN